jgi:hypothetical protein
MESGKEAFEPSLSEGGAYFLIVDWVLEKRNAKERPGRLGRTTACQK